jgi:hypothetical protein
MARRAKTPSPARREECHEITTILAPMQSAIFAGDFGALQVLNNVS